MPKDSLPASKNGRCQDFAGVFFSELTNEYGQKNYFRIIHVMIF